MKIVELYNTNSDIYWNVDEFLKGYGYKNVQEFCTYEKDTLGTKDYCENIVQTAMYEQAENDLEGWNCLIRFKVISKKGYKNKLLAIHTNSTYLGNLDTVNKDTVQSLIDCYL